PSIPTGGAETIHLRARVSCSVVDGSVIANTASATAATPDLDPSNNSATANISAFNPPPKFTIAPGDITQPTDPGRCSAVVNWSIAASDGTCGPVPVVCTPASGSTFPTGVTPVNCTATDAGGGKAVYSFLVTVIDTTPPVITNVKVDPPVLWPPN